MTRYDALRQILRGLEQIQVEAEFDDPTFAKILNIELTQWRKIRSGQIVPGLMYLRRIAAVYPGLRPLICTYLLMEGYD